MDQVVEEQVHLQLEYQQEQQEQLTQEVEVVEVVMDQLAIILVDQAVQESLLLELQEVLVFQQHQELIQ